MEIVSESKKQRYAKPILDENGNQIAFIDGLESKQYKLVILLDSDKPYKAKFFVDNSDEGLIEMAKDMRKIGCPSL